MTVTTGSDVRELGRHSGAMAAGTLASRATGFLRVAVVAAAIGTRTQVADAYNVANTAPNIVYELLLGGVLTSVVVPGLVRAAREDGDDGSAFGQVLLSLVMLVLGVTSVVSVIAAPWLMRVYLHDVSPAEFTKAVAFARFLLPQILFYGVGATVGAILNTRGRFTAPMATPVLNNLVVIATAGVFILLPGPRPPDPAGMTTAQTLTLGIGTSLGVVVMTLALLPSLRAVGFRWRLRLRHPRVRGVVRLAMWVLVYVAANQLGYVIVARLASSITGYTTYAYAFLLFQLPHAVITVSVVTALLPRMSRHAADDDLAALRDDISQGLRLAAAAVIPAALGYVVLGRAVAVAVFAHGVTTAPDAHLVGSVLAAFALGLAFFSAFQLQLRAFYAMHDSRTPALVNIAVNAVNVAADVVLFVVLDGSARIVGLALGYGLSYAVGAAVFARILRRRLGGLDGRRVARTVTRIVVAAMIAAFGAYGASRLAMRGLGTGVRGSIAAIAAGVVAAVPLYVVSARRMRLTEIDVLGSIVRARVRR
ncbi:MAG: murein biosynthesis integral membrane protein MurJ [Frankia sp.]|nr:murein biosynthesis integral membrane protein MurJ [Frankia sp.]